MSYNWNYRNVLKTTGEILQYSSFIHLLPIILSLFFKEGLFVTNTYILIFLLQFTFGLLLARLVKSKLLFGITTSQSLIVVILVWLLFTFFCALPIYFLSPMGLFDSFFGAMSLLTTTGLSLYENIFVFKSLLVWNSFVSWIGGLGIIILAFLGFTKGLAAGSTKVVMAEGHERLRPSIKKTVFNLWVIYLLLTVVGVALLKIFGMTLFDAFNYSMSAISTTGPPYGSESLALVITPVISLILIFIMLLGATSFILHFKALQYRKKNLLVYLKDKQFLGMLTIIFIAFILCVIKLGGKHSLIDLLLNVVSFITGGGITTFSSNILVSLSPFILLIYFGLMFIGGSSNSTSAGIKVERFVLFLKSIFWKIKETTLPDIAYFPKKYNGEIIENSKIRAVYFLILIYFFFILLGIFVFVFNGYGLTESTFEVMSAQSTVGISSGITSFDMPFATKLMLVINMWVGRLEIIPVLAVIGIIFSRKYNV